MRDRVLVMGEALTDLVPTRDGSLLPTPGGAPANVAAALAVLGVPTSFGGALGDDVFGQAHRKRLTAAGVDLGLCADSPLPTALAVASPAPHGNRYDFHLGATATFHLTPLTDRLTDFAALYTGGLAAVVDPAAEAVHATAQAAAGRLLLVVDPNVRADRTIDPGAALRRLRALCDLAHVVKASDEDVRQLWPDEEPAATCRALAAGGRLVLLTQGAGGATAFLADGTSVSVPPTPVTVVDTIGAGDAFTAGALAGLDASNALRPRAPSELSPTQALDLLTLASRMAAAACATPGANLATTHAREPA
ncbi:PfkB family carbohydrate kinase [Streptomyces sp. NPDC048603]|uniref:PfkB family carbohydrate kinase n=1 Tax=Streptomyces sp. NPDC048603 TaxID=3365577 RepID=UPI00371E0793